MKWEIYQQLNNKNMGKIKSGNVGFLGVEDVQLGDVILMYSEPQENEFSFTNDKGEIIEGMNWRVKVLLPSGIKKLATIPSKCHDDIIAKFGDETADYVGMSLVIELDKWGKLLFSPSDKPRDMSVVKPADKPLTDEEKATLQAARDREMEKPPFESEERNQSADKF